MNNATPETLDRLLQGAGLRRDSQLAELLGVSPQAVSQARRKGRIPDGWVLKIAEQFGLSTDWLFFGKGPGPEAQEAPAEAAERKIGLLGVGEKMEDLKLFNPKEFIGALFD